MANARPSVTLPAIDIQALFSKNFYIFDVLQYSNRFEYIKDIRQATYFNNQKIIAYHF